MSDDKDWQAHYQCHQCEELRYKGDIIHVDDKPICKDGPCRSRYYASSTPIPVPKSLARFEHG